MEFYKEFRNLRSLKRSVRKFYETRIKQDPKVIGYHDYLSKGGEALRLNYPLKRDSIVIDAGGYHGDFAADIICKYNCKVDVFEPVRQYALQIEERFRFNDRVSVVEAGLGASEKEEYISVAEAGSTVFPGRNDYVTREKIRIISVQEYIQSKGYSEVDLLKVNIEGGEYDLLDSILKCAALIHSIKFLQIQFHDFVPEAEVRRLEIRRKLSGTHKLMWDFPFIWESWERR